MAITAGTAKYFGQSPASVVITAATNATPIVCTAAGHGLVTGNKVSNFGGLVNTAVNGVFVVTVTDRDTFSLNGSVGNGVYTASSATCSQYDGQVALFGGTDNLRTALFGAATITGDAATSTFNVNFIDGTDTLPFTPTAVLAWRTGGTEVATVGIASVTAVTNIKFTCNLTAVSGAGTTIVSFIALK